MNKLIQKKSGIENMELNEVLGLFEPNIMPRAVRKRFENQLKIANKTNKKEEWELASQLAMKAQSFESGYLLGYSSTDEEYRVLAYDYCEHLINEYSCIKASEKALCHLIASSYVRVLEFSKKMATIMNIDYLSDIKSRHYSVLSKEIERSTKQYESLFERLLLLKGLRAQINVKNFNQTNNQLNLFSN